MIEVRENARGVSFLVRVQPRASRSEIAGERDGGLRIRLMAPAHEGRANESLRRLLAALLRVPPSDVTIAQGEHSRTKRIQISGVKAEDVRQRLAESAPSAAGLT
jgi:uncharacterized protein